MFAWTRSGSGFENRCKSADTMPSRSTTSPGHARILRVISDQGLPVIARFSKGTNTQVDRGPTHVLRLSELPELSVCTAIDCVTAPDSR